MFDKSLNFHKNPPAQVCLELSNMCNAQCIICPIFQGERAVDRKKRQAQNMSYALFEKLAYEIKEWCPQATIFLNMFGEPLFDPNFCTKVELLNKLSLSKNVYLQTNGSLLSEKISQCILENNIGTIVPCFDAVDEALFERIRNGVSFVQAFDNIGKFIELRESLQAETKIAIQHVVTKINKGQHRLVYDLFKNLLRENDVLNVQTASAWSSVEIRKLTDLEFTQYQNSHNCDFLESSLIVLADGQVCACCNDYNLDLGSLGDVTKESMQEVWSNPQYLEITKSISSKSNSLKYPCVDCTYLFADYARNNEMNYDFDSDKVMAGHHGVIVKFGGKI